MPQSILMQQALQGLKNEGLTKKSQKIPGFDDYELQGMDPSVQNELYRNNFQHEYEDKAARGYRTGDQNEVNENLFRLKQLGSEYAASPLREQEQDVSNIQAADDEGFDEYQGRYNPLGAKAAYGRGLETQKINAPIRVAEANAQGDRDVEALRGKALRDVATTNAGPYNRAQDRLDNPNFIQGLQEMGDTPVKSFSSNRNGMSVGFQNTPKAPSPANINPLQAQLTGAQQNLGDLDPWDAANANDPKVQTFRTAAGQLISSTDDDPTVKMDAQNWLNKKYTDPNEADLNNWDTSDPHVMAVLNLIRRIRGF